MRDNRIMDSKMRRERDISAVIFLTALIITVAAFTLLAVLQ